MVLSLVLICCGLSGVFEAAPVSLCPVLSASLLSLPASSSRPRSGTLRDARSLKLNRTEVEAVVGCSVARSRREAQTLVGLR